MRNTLRMSRMFAMPCVTNEAEVLDPLAFLDSSLATRRPCREPADLFAQVFAGYLVSAAELIGLSTPAPTLALSDGAISLRTASGSELVNP